MPIPALPPAPQPTDPREVFKPKSFTWVAALSAWTTAVNDAGTAINADRVAAQAAAATATGARADAIDARDVAQAAEATAIDRATVAVAAALQASRLNLGEKTVPPTTDNDGNPLTVGATYFDTSLTPKRWRVWDGAAWADGISAIAGVTSLNGSQGALMWSTLAAYGITDATAKATVQFNASALMADAPLGQWAHYLSTGTAGADWPTTQGTAWWNVVTLGIGTRASQIAIQAFSSSGQGGAMYVRSKHDATWGTWRRAGNQNEAPIALAGGAINCALGVRFTETVSANRTLSFVNVPADAYACVVEINHTGGTITLPAGSVASNGSLPPLVTGKRHLLYFEKCLLGSAGWYVSALPGYTT